MEVKRNAFSTFNSRFITINPLVSRKEGRRKFDFGERKRFDQYGRKKKIRFLFSFAPFIYFNFLNYN